MKNFATFITEVRIQLRGRGNYDDTNAKAFMDDLHNNHDIHPFDPDQHIIHNTVVHASKDGHQVHIHDLRTLDPDKGNGTKALKHLTAMADKHGVKLNLHAKAYSKQPEHVTKTHQLVSWYKKHGFTHDHPEDDHSQGSDMTYYPR